ASFERAIEILTELGDRRLQASGLAGLGAVDQDAGRWSEAEALYERALAIEREIGDAHLEAVTRGRLGSLALERDAPEVALHRYEAACELAEVSGDRRGLGMYRAASSVAAALLGRTARVKTMREA